MNSQTATIIVGTAGHIDHGKTSLIRTLTGVNLDSTPEEAERGITISLGFTSLDLKQGGRVAFVDVPGHERLVQTMVSGATGIDAVLFVISAIDGVMPQTLEHLEILTLLGVQGGAIVLTMADLVDEELLELAMAEIEDTVIGTPLEDAPIIPFSSVDGTGKEEVLALLETLKQRERPTSGAFRLPIDRHFTNHGFGTIITGTTWSGTLNEGDAVTLLPSGITSRARALQAHGGGVSTLTPGLRGAINLANIERSALAAGEVVTTGEVPCCNMIDVHLHNLKRGQPLKEGSEVRLLHGTTDVMARLYLTTEDGTLQPGESAMAQLRLSAALPCLPNDRFILRMPSPQITLGGGHIIDCWPPRLRKKNRKRCAQELSDLDGGDVNVWLTRAGDLGIPVATWAVRAPDSDAGVTLAGNVYAHDVIARLSKALLAELTLFHKENPLVSGPGKRELLRGRLAHIPQRLFDGILTQLIDADDVTVDGPTIQRKGFSISLTKDQEELHAAIHTAFKTAGLTGLTIKMIAKKYDNTDATTVYHMLINQGLATLVPGIGAVLCKDMESLTAQITAWFASNTTLSPGDLKGLTGLSRKSAIPILEWLDAHQVTRRTPDGRVPF